MKFRFKQNLGWVFAVIICIVPLGFWYTMRPLSFRFFDKFSALTSLGQISGLLGMAIFCMSLILSSRVRFLESYFGGLNKIYRIHHLLGGIAFLLLLFHPLVLAAKFAMISFRDAALFLLPGSNNAINFGIIALAILIILLFVTYFVKLRYHLWKISHKFLGLAFFFAIFHTFFATSDVSRNMPLRVYMAGLVVVSVFAFLYRTLIGWILVSKLDYGVVNVREMQDNTIEIEMCPRGKALKFLAGQFIYLSFYSEGIKTEYHPFSLSSGALDKNLKVSVKALGDYTATLKNVKPGSDVKVEGPYGRFSYQKGYYNRQVWIGGGIGITPFMSMAKDFKDKDMQVDLYYAFVSSGKAPFLEELMNIASGNPNLRVFAFGQDKEGFITAEAVAKNSGDLFKKDIFLCGPPAMITNLKAQFKKMNIPKKNIHSEEFNYS